MTPKQEYEARKAERKKLDDLDYQVRSRTETLMILDMLDRFVTATERIADALDRQTPICAGTTAPGRPVTTWGMSQNGVG